MLASIDSNQKELEATNTQLSELRASSREQKAALDEQVPRTARTAAAKHSSSFAPATPPLTAASAGPRSRQALGTPRTWKGVKRTAFEPGGVAVSDSITLTPPGSGLQAARERQADAG